MLALHFVSCNSAKGIELFIHVMTVELGLTGALNNWIYHSIMRSETKDSSRYYEMTKPLLKNDRSGVGSEAVNKNKAL